MLLEGTEASCERMEHRLRQLRRLARVKHVLEQYALAKDMALQFGDVPVGLGKMLLFLSHRFCAGKKKPAEKVARFSFGFLRQSVFGLPRLRHRLKLWWKPMARAKRVYPSDAPARP